MKREIKFRGKCLNTKEWVYGFFVNDGFDFIYSVDENDFLVKNTVDGLTVGQYTGLKDRNGREIYEGDILLFAEELKSIVEFRHGMFGYEFCGNFIGYGGNYHFDFNPSDKSSKHEVIGNIHDNPELIKKIE